MKNVIIETTNIIKRNRNLSKIQITASYTQSNIRIPSPFLIIQR